MPRININIPQSEERLIAPQEMYPYSEVDMVNRCLRAIGEVPVPEGTFLGGLQVGTDAEIAKRNVNETMKEVQSIGWYFNTNYDVKLYPDTNKEIVLDDLVLRVDTYRDNQYVMKSDKMYDVYNNTFEITVDYIEADVVTYTTYSDLPIEAYEYIALRSARKFQEEVITASELVEVTRTKEMDAFSRLQRRQLQTQAYNIQNARVSTRTHNGYVHIGLYNTRNRR